MRERFTGRWWVGVAAGLALGLGAVIAVQQSTGEATASSQIRLTTEQLQINQRISQAAVRRSNEALQLLDPIRKDEKQPTKVLGWRTQDIRDGAVTPAKLTDSLREAQPRWAVVDAGSAKLLRARGATASAKLSTVGLYTVTFDRDVSACAIQATIADGGTTEVPVGQVSAWRSATAANTVTVRTAAEDTAGVAKDTNTLPFHVTVLC